MIDLRPVGYVIGLLVLALGGTMALPFAMDTAAGNGNAPAFLESAIVTILVGGAMTLASANAVGSRLTIQQAFLITSGVWLALPIFGALPFVVGATEARPVDAFFEAMSGMTTTGSTVLSGLDELPQGLLLWRAMLQWFGGIGIIVVAMAFLPELRVGGMQIFRIEAFDTFGKILPRAGEIATRISVIYLGLTMACALSYMAFGMSTFDGITHAMTTVATGGFANYDTSFGGFAPGVEYSASLFMLLAALPFVRYIQLIGGAPQALFTDAQVRGLAIVVGTVVGALTVYLWLTGVIGGEIAFRKALFNVMSVLTGTGYASTDYMTWGSFAIVVIFFVGLIGGSAGSTACSIKIFRYQILIASIRTQVRAIHSPHGIHTTRYDGRPVDEEIISSVMAFFVLFVVTLGVTSVLLGATGLDFITSVSGAATALANIGPGLGPEIGPAGNFAGLSDTAKWILITAMYIGRLELMSVYVILTARFWQA